MTTHTPSQPSARRPAPLALLVLLLALLASACAPSTSTAAVSRGLETQPDGWRGLPLDVERSMPEVTLLDTDDQPVELAAHTAGSPTLLFFGYTSCPDMCQVHLSAIASAMRDAGVSTSDLDVVFVSVDPERDTPERIEEWLSYFDRGVLGLHEDLEVVEVALSALDLPGPIVEGPDPRGEGDLIGHPAQVIGFDAAGNARRVWPFGARRADWISDLPLIVEQWS